MTVLFDLDNTLLRTGMLSTLVLADLAQATGRTVEELYAIADGMEWAYSFQGLLVVLGVDEGRRGTLMSRYNVVMYKEANACLFSGVVEIVHACAAREDVGLLTRGVIHHQRGKVAALTYLHGAFVREHFVPPHAVKGVVILEEYGDTSDVTVVDDNIDDLTGMVLHVPRARLIRMAWPERNPQPHPNDGVRWSVATSAEDLKSLLLRT